MDSKDINFEYRTQVLWFEDSATLDGLKQKNSGFLHPDIFEECK